MLSAASAPASSSSEIVSMALKVAIGGAALGAIWGSVVAANGRKSESFDGRGEVKKGALVGAILGAAVGALAASNVGLTA
jgi:hypothetical protein